MTPFIGRRLYPLLVLSLSLATACASRPQAPTANLSDGVTGHPITLRSAHDAMAKVRHIYVAENHESSIDHFVQLQVLAEAHRLDEGVALAIEWLPHTLQDKLNTWLAGSGSKESFLEIITWKKTWGFSLDLYWPILSWAHEHAIPIYALNAPRNLVFGFSQHGREGLSEKELDQLPPLDSANKTHRDFFVHMMRKAAEKIKGAQHHSGFEEHIDAYYQAQLIWDETMAAGVSRWLLKSNNATKTIVVLAGRGHIDFGLGIPKRVQATTGLPYLIITPSSTAAPASTSAQEAQNGFKGPRAHIFWQQPSSH